MKTKLYCIPYSGATASTYAGWKDYISDSLELCPVELAGRGSRFRDSFYTDFDVAVKDIFNIIKESCHNGDYAIFGHSLGGLLAFELSRLIQKESFTAPLHVFISGHNTPDLRQPKKLHTLTDDDLLNYLDELGGTTTDFRENKDVLNLFKPVIRADFKLIDDYEFEKISTKLNDDITIFHGSDDFFTGKDLERWDEFTNGNVSYYEFTGGHFFINNHTEKIVNIINQTVEVKKIYV